MGVLQKMMAIAGRDSNGKARALKVTSEGVMKTEVTGSVVEDYNEDISIDPGQIVVLFEFVDVDYNYNEFEMLFNVSGASRVSISMDSTTESTSFYSNALTALKPISFSQFGVDGTYQKTDPSRILGKTYRIRARNTSSEDSVLIRKVALKRWV